MGDEPSREELLALVRELSDQLAIHRGATVSAAQTTQLAIDRIQRMEPVVEAARTWHEAERNGSDDGESEDRLRIAIMIYLARERSAS